MVLNYPDLGGRVALVTGGSRGIGAATCRLLATNGVKVAVGGRDKQAISAVVKDIDRVGGTALPVPADVTDAEALHAVTDKIARELGPITILAAFAGGEGAPTPSTMLTAGRWRAVLESDLTAAFLTISAVLPAMIEAGGGSIVTMSSAAGRQPSEANVAYAVAKAGVTMLTRHLANELGPQHVRVNCLAPSAVRNERMERYMSTEQFAQLAAAFPLGRIGEPADVAQAAAFLASDASSWITGVTLDLSGGRVIV
jgi:3-oxoacyl-[acyl-carrier protein] reductase